MLLRECDLHLRFDSEDDARAHIEQALAEFFHLVPEVWLKHVGGKRLRIDYVAYPRRSAPVEMRPGLIGIEVKRGFETHDSAFIRTLQQGVDYRHAVVVDHRASNSKGRPLDFVFIFPDCPSHFGHAGAVRLAGRYNVGVISEKDAPWDDRSEIELRVADSVLWRSTQGVRGAMNFGRGRRVGSQ